MSKIIRLQTYTTKDSYITKGYSLYDTEKAKLWNKVKHPKLLSVPCLHLDEFNTDPVLSVGNPVYEMHNFFGLKQEYEGVISSAGAFAWSMKTWPRIKSHWFGLPHSVSYECSESDGKTRLDVCCTYEPMGLFRLPLLKQLIRFEMERTIRILLNSPTN